MAPPSHVADQRSHDGVVGGRFLAPDSPEAIQLRKEAMAAKAERDAEMKGQYVRKLKRRAMQESAVRWGAAFTMIICTTAFLTLIVANGLCEQFSMAMSCEHELQTKTRLPILATIVIAILCVTFPRGPSIV